MNPIVFFTALIVFFLVFVIVALTIIVRGGGKRRHHAEHAAHEHHPSPFVEFLKQLGTAIGVAAIPVAALWLGNSQSEWQTREIFAVCVLAGFASTTVLEWLARLWAWSRDKEWEPTHGHGDDFKSYTGYLVAYLLGAFMLEVVGGRLWSSLPHLVVLDTLPQIGMTFWNVCRFCGAVVAIWLTGRVLESFLNDFPKILVGVWIPLALFTVFVCSGGLTTGTGVVDLMKGNPVAFDELYDRWINSSSMWGLALTFSFFHEYSGKKGVIALAVIPLTVIHAMWVGQVILFNPYLIQTFQNVLNR